MTTAPWAAGARAKARAARPRLRSLTLVLVVAAVSACQAAAPRGASHDPPDVEWPAYAGSHASTRYSPLDQIDRSNVGQLRVAWR